jgi:methylmalonyl-CoA/ethylmalonyl-CoA epimerase
MEHCREAGVRLLDETPRTGAGGKQIAFLHPKSGGGVLIEICAEP